MPFLERVTPHVVEHLHIVKIFVPHADDYDADSLFFEVLQGVQRLAHVVDDPVGDYQEKIVVELAQLSLLLAVQFYLLKEGREKSRAARLDVLKRIRVDFEKLLDRSAIRFVEIELEREKMADLFLVRLCFLFANLHRLARYHALEIHNFANKWAGISLALLDVQVLTLA